LVTRRVPTKGFRDASYIASPFPRLRLAQRRRQRFGGLAPHNAASALGGQPPGFPGKLRHFRKTGID
jgi:hypothetical protein